MYFGSNSETDSRVRRRLQIKRKLIRLAFLLALFGFGAVFGAMLQANAMNSEKTYAAAADGTNDGESKAVYGNVSAGSTTASGSGSAVVCVSPGDTLWSIAKEYGPKDVPIKTYIQEIMRANSLTSASLQAGDVLILP